MCASGVCVGSSSDADGDGILDCLDGCPNDPNKVEPGICGCDVPDDDFDGDGVADCVDGCPGDPTKLEPGICGCDAPDDDFDGDGVADCVDGCPGDPTKLEPGICGCDVPDDDSDGDGTPDCFDPCPDDACDYCSGFSGDAGGGTSDLVGFFGGSTSILFRSSALSVSRATAPRAKSGCTSLRPGVRP